MARAMVVIGNNSLTFLRHTEQTTALIFTQNPANQLIQLLNVKWNQMVNTNRKRTIVWEDPKSNTRDSTLISGLDYLKSIKEGKIAPPPVSMLIGYKIVEVDEGFAVYELYPEEYHHNPFSMVHGGILSTLLDTAMTASVLSTLQKGISCSTIEIKVNFIRPVTTKIEVLKCEAKLIHIGKTTAVAEGKLKDNDNKLYASGVTTCSIFKL